MSKPKIAIVGFSETSRHLAPFDDPDVEIWGCNHLYRFIPRGDVWFELHDLEELEVKYGTDRNWPEYRKWLTEQTMPIYMKEAYPDIPSSVRYPIEDMQEKYYFLESFPDPENPGKRKTKKRSTFKSTLSYMLALALEQEGVEEIHVYGVDMLIDSEWWFQRHNMYLFMGWARGKGIQLVLPTECALLKEGAADLYGYEHSTKWYVKLIKVMKDQDAHYRQQLKSLEKLNRVLAAKTQGFAGIIEELEQLLKIEQLNGAKPLLEERLKKYRAEFEKCKEKNDETVNQMQHTEGARQDNWRWVERLGYNDRGDQLI